MALKFLPIILILALHPTTPESHWKVPHSPPENPPPLCSSQFALANPACSRLPYTLVPPPSPPAPPSPPSPRNGHSHGHGHGHGLGHRRQRKPYKETQVEEECCRWLREVDTVCACDQLAQLPPFLTMPVHNYTVVVDESCIVTFQCGSKVVQF